VRILSSAYVNWLYVVSCYMCLTTLHHTHTHTLGDCSVLLNTNEDVKRLQEAILMEDPDLLVDLY